MQGSTVPVVGVPIFTWIVLGVLGVCWGLALDAQDEQCKQPPLGNSVVVSWFWFNFSKNEVTTLIIQYTRGKPLFETVFPKDCKEDLGLGSPKFIDFG